MKLNNRGWGLQVMMIFVLILMICLVIVAALINKDFGFLVKDNNTVDTSFDYTKLESKVSSAAKKYFEANVDVKTVTIKKLQDENLINDVRDNFSKCTGYVVKENNDYISYIKCGNNYKTKNYNSNLDL